MNYEGAKCHPPSQISHYRSPKIRGRNGSTAAEQDQKEQGSATTYDSKL